MHQRYRTGGANRRTPLHIIRIRVLNIPPITIKLLKDFYIEPNMSRQENCHENAVANSFFANLKKEKIRRKRFATRDDAKQAMFNYIELFYNPSRRQTLNNRVSPAVIDREYFVNQQSV